MGRWARSQQIGKSSLSGYNSFEVTDQVIMACRATGYGVEVFNLLGSSSRR